MRDLLETSAFTTPVKVSVNGEMVAAEQRDQAAQAFADRTRYLKDIAAPASRTVPIDLAAAVHSGGWSRSSPMDPWAAVAPGDSIYLPLIVAPGASILSLEARIDQDLSTGPASVALVSLDFESVDTTIQSDSLPGTPGWQPFTLTLTTAHLPTTAVFLRVSAGSAGDGLSGGRMTYGFI